MSDHARYTSRSPEEILNKANLQIPRISVSDVAAIANLNPWKSVESMIDKYLYQDCNDLLELDSNLLGLEMITDEEQVMNIMKKIPAKNRKVLTKVKESIDRAEGVETAIGCEKLLQEAKNVLKNQEGVALSAEEVTFLQEQFRSGAHTGYGNTREADVLSAYEAVTGHSVASRNDKFLLAPLNFLCHQVDRAGSRNDLVIDQKLKIAPLASQHHFMRFATTEEHERIKQKTNLSYRIDFFDKFAKTIVNSCISKAGVPSDAKNLIKHFENCFLNVVDGSDEILPFPKPFACFYSRTLPCHNPQLCADKSFDDVAEPKALTCRDRPRSIRMSVLHVLLDLCEEVVDAQREYTTVDKLFISSKVSSSIETDIESPRKRPRPSEEECVTKERVQIDCVQITSSLSQLDAQMFLSALDRNIEKIKDTADENMNTCTILYSVSLGHSRKTGEADTIFTGSIGSNYLNEIVDLTADSSDDSVVIEDKSLSETSVHSPFHSITIWIVSETAVPMVPSSEYHSSHFWSPTVMTCVRPTEGTVYPDYYLIGLVDGLSQQLDCSDECASNWAAHTVVIEAKCRISPLRDHQVPPLHDQIQLVTYLHMLGLTEGDLVEWHMPGIGSRTSLDEKLGSRILAPVPSLNITRVSLSCQVYRHGHHWNHVVRPRLEDFVRAIRNLRADDALRYQWLIATDTEKAMLSQQLMPLH